MSGPAETLPAEVWRGQVNAWECDEMGHMNVRFYIARALEGLYGLALELGLPDAASPDAASTLRPLEHHVRYLHEAREGAALDLRAGVLEATEEELRVAMVLRHSASGRTCATVVSRVAHVTARDGRAFPWSGRTRAAAERLKVELPAEAAPKGLTLGPVTSQASGERARALGMMATARGMAGAQDCDVFGRLRGDAVMGRFSDGASHLFGDVREGPEGQRIGGAMLECRMLHLGDGRIGDHLQLYSALGEVMAKTERVFHWLTDAAAGRALVACEAVAGRLDLDARRLWVPPPEERAARERLVVKGLGL